MEFRILGPLEVEEDGQVLKLGGAQPRALLALLLLHANEVVPRDRLIEELWEGRPPETAPTAVQVHVSQLRKVLGPDVIVTQPPGYLVRTHGSELDVSRFEESVGRARTRPPAEAAELLRDALALWRGEPLADLDGPSMRVERGRLEERRLAAVEQRIDADLQLGLHVDLVSELEGLVGEHPLRERLRGQLMLALYRSGRQADALAAYQGGRRLLVDELGLEPGDALQQLERAILNHDPALAAPAATARPAGTVTMLFSDVEGSTQLLERLGAEAYADALEQHRRVLRDAFARHDGYEVDTQGDAFFVAFPRAAAAVAAAEEAGRALADGPVRVRMGLHTGEPIQTGDGYVGMDVHKGARIAAAGHGGQVLLSSTTRDLIDADVRDLGEHRLKDMTAPARLYQLGQEEFPPLKTLDATNLPVAASALLGREREVSELTDLLRNGTRLVTLTGPGGTGKTRLALQVAAELVGSFEHGVFWVPLAALSEPELVVPQIAQTIGARSELEAHVRDKEMLLLVDNLEHLLAASPALGELLASSKRLRLLVTSRAPLHVRGEREYPLDPLAETDAVTLFVERARDAGRDLEPDDTIAAVCRRLDGLPLAIELAAARTKLLAPATLLDRLDHALPLLTGGARDAPERQQTLRATIEWSYELLDDAAKVLYARLSVFAGSFSLEAAEEVCEANVDALAGLVDLSVLKPIEGSRFLMLETIREHAAERLAADELEALRARHIEHFIALADAMRDDLIHGRPEAVDMLRRDQGNFRASFEFAAADTASDGLARLIRSLKGGGPWWNGIGTLDDAQRWIEHAIERTDTESTMRPELLLNASWVAYQQRDPQRAKAQLAEALELARALGDPMLEAAALQGLGSIAVDDGDLAEGISLLEQALEAFRAAGDDRRVSRAVTSLATYALQHGDVDRARALYTEALAFSRADESAWEVATDLLNLALVDIREGDLKAAAPRVEEALETGLGLPRGMVVPYALVEFAAVAVSARPDLAVQLLTAARREVAELHESLEPLEQELYDQVLDEARAQLTASEFDTAQAAGERMSLEDASELALSLRGG